MADFLRRNSLFLSAFVLLAISSQLMSASVRNPELPALGARMGNTLFGPVEKLHSESANGLSDIWKNYLWLVNTKKSQEDLQLQIKGLQKKNSELVEFQHENRRLRSMLGFTKQVKNPGVPANVIARDPSNWLKTLRIDKGDLDQIDEGSPVVDGHAIVGLTTAVSKNSARIQLLSDPNSAIDAVVQRTRAPGVVEGNGRDTLSLRYLEKFQDVQIGDRVVASGLDEMYPKGTLIGVVTEVDDKIPGLFQRVKVKPGVDLNNLETVLVIEKGLAIEKLKAGVVDSEESGGGLEKNVPAGNSKSAKDRSKKLAKKSTKKGAKKKLESASKVSRKRVSGKKASAKKTSGRKENLKKNQKKVEADD